MGSSWRPAWLLWTFVSEPLNIPCLLRNKNVLGHAHPDRERVDMVSGRAAQSLICVQASPSGIGLNKEQSSHGLAALEHRGP